MTRIDDLIANAKREFDLTKEEDQQSLYVLSEELLDLNIAEDKLEALAILN